MFGSSFPSASLPSSALQLQRTAYKVPLPTCSRVSKRRCVWRSIRNATSVEDSNVFENTRNVYVSKKPLVGWERLESILGPFYPKELALHCMVWIKNADDEVLMCDFLPKDPALPETTLKLLSGGKAGGLVRVKQLPSIPNRQVWYAGQSMAPDPYSTIEKFNREWDPMLQLVVHDCRSYTNELVEELTGKSNVLNALGI